MIKWAAIAHDTEKVAERHFFEFYGFRYAWKRIEYKGLRHLINHGVFPWLTIFKLLYHIKMKNI